MIATLLHKLLLFAADRRGTAALEYGLLVAFVAAAVMGGMSTVGGEIGESLNELAMSLANVSSR